MTNKEAADLLWNDITHHENIVQIITVENAAGVPAMIATHFEWAYQRGVGDLRRRLLAGDSLAEAALALGYDGAAPCGGSCGDPECNLTLDGQPLPEKHYVPTNTTVPTDDEDLTR